jgi:hypothetical protein
VKPDPTLAPDPALDKIKVEPGNETVTPTALAERSFFEREQEESLARKVELRKLRSGYALKLFVLLCGWVTAILILLICQGAGSFFGTRSFHLDDKVLIAAIGSTTVNVIGLFYVVVRYIFPEPKAPRKKKDEESGE